MTIDDEPAANSECYLTFRLDGVGAGDDPFFGVARWADNDNFYGIGGYPNTTDGLAIFKNVSGTVTTLATATGTGNLLATGTGQGIDVHVSDSTKELLIDGTSKLSTSDNALTV